MNETSRPGRDKVGAEAVRRLRMVLRATIRLRETSFRHIEREMGLSVGYLTRILDGRVALRVTHVLGICSLLGVAPGDLFAAVFPASDDSLRRALTEIGNLEIPRAKASR